MKKRVSTSEIELAKSSNRRVFILSIVCVVVLFAVVGTLCLLNIDNMNKPDDFEKKGLSIEKNAPVAISLDNEDENIKELFEIVKMSNNLCTEDYVEKDFVDVSKLNDRCKWELVSTSYKDNTVKSSDGKITVEEKYVKRAYEKLFGTGTYKRVDTIPYQNMTLIYRDNNYYIDKAVDAKKESLVRNEIVVKSIREGDLLSITSSIVYYEKNLNLLCRDIKCKYVLETIDKNKNYNEDYLNLYIEHNMKKLYQYTYKFEADDGGFYHYLGYQKTNQ